MTVSTISGNFVNYVIPQEKEAAAIQHLERWKMGNKEICLQRSGEQLSYEVLDTLTGKTTQGRPFDLAGHNIEDVIPYLLECQPQISETGGITFSSKPPLPYIQRWIIGDREITLRRNEDQLICEVFDNFTRQSKHGSIGLDGHKDLLSYLLRCQPEVLEIGVSFSPRPPPRYTWTFRNKEVQLWQKDQDLIWQLFDKSTKTVSQASFNVGFLNSDEGHHCFSPKTSNRFSVDEILERSSQKSPKCRLNIFKDCEIEKLEVKPTPHSSAYRLSAIYAKRIVGKSQLDPSVPIDRTRWAVTLINSGVSGLSNPLTWGGHAAIIVEGIRKGAFVTYKAHLRKINGKAVVLLQEEDEKISYSQKGETWKVNRSDAKRMLEAISYELEKQERLEMKKHDKKDPKVEVSEEKDDPPVFFDARGCESKLVKPRVVKEYASYHDLVRDTLELECVDSSSSLSHPIPYKSITLIDKTGKRRILDNRQFEIQDVQISSPQRIFIQNPSNDKWSEVRLPDNCLTWAARKLEYCGIYLKGNYLLKSIFALPRMYMAQGMALQDYAVSRLFCRMNTLEESEDLTPLMRAIKEGDVDEVEALLAGEVDLNAKNNKGFNAFHLACEIGATRIVNLLHKKGMDINEPADDYLRSTPLFLAIKNNHERLIWFLLKLGAKIDQRDAKTGNTILHLISSFCSSDLVLPEIFIKDNVNRQNNEGITPLMLAVASKKKEMARQLLQYGASLHRKDEWGRTALWHAYNSEDEEVVQLLIDHGANLKAVFSERGLTPLQAAVIDKKLKMACVFLKNRVSTDQKDELGYTAPLWYAYVNGDAKMAQLLIDYGANLNAVFKQSGYTPLQTAVIDEKLEMARVFLQNKAPVDQKDKLGNTVLWYAYGNGDDEMMRLLIEHGINLNAAFNQGGGIPIVEAVKNKEFEIARIFLQKGASVDQKDKLGNTVLWYAYDNGDEEMMKLLIEHGINLNAAFNQGGGIPIVEAVKNKEFEIARMFLQKGASVDQEDVWGQRPLWYAYKNGDEEMIKLLIEHGVNLKAPFDVWKIPLIEAVKDKKFEIARLFLQKGASVDQKDKLGNRALWYAYKNGDDEMMRLLIEHGVNLKVPFDMWKSLPLIEAVKDKKFEIARLFLQKGASVDQKDRLGNRALWYAYKNGDEEMMRLLIEHDANLILANLIFANSSPPPFIETVKDKKLGIARVFLQNKASVDQKDELDNTALWYAYKNGDEEMVKLLIEYGANLNAAFKQWGCIPLIKAVKDKKFEMARLFLQNKASVDQKDIWGNTPLWYAYNNVDEEMMKLLIEHRANLDTIFNEQGLTPLQAAVKDRKFEIVCLFLQKGASVDQKDKLGNTAFWYAYNNGDEKMMKLLIEHRANLDTIFNEQGLTPLQAAVKDRKFEMVCLFLQNKASVDQKSKCGDTALWYAYENGDEEMAEFLIKCGVNLNVVFNRQGYTPLQAAVKDREFEMARLFLRNKAFVDQKDKDGNTAFWYAYKQGDEEMMKLLIEYEGNLNIVFNKSGSTPLTKAVRDNKLETARLFLQNKASVGQKDGCGYSSLLYAYKIGDEEMVKLLIKYGADLNAVFNEGGSIPLIQAAKDKKFAMARLFLQNKASVDQKDKDDNTALFYAYENGDEEMVNLLIAYGAYFDPSSSLNRAFEEQKAKNHITSRATKKPFCLLS